MQQQQPPAATDKAKLSDATKAIIKDKMAGKEKLLTDKKVVINVFCYWTDGTIT